MTSGCLRILFPNDILNFDNIFIALNIPTILIFFFLLLYKAGMHIVFYCTTTTTKIFKRVFNSRSFLFDTKLVVYLPPSVIENNIVTSLLLRARRVRAKYIATRSWCGFIVLPSSSTTRCQVLRDKENLTCHLGRVIVWIFTGLYNCRASLFLFIIDRHTRIILSRCTCILYK